MPVEADKLVMLTLVPEIPPENVEVAVEVLRMEPPVIVSPREAEREVAPIPPEKVEVAVPVFSIEPPVRVRPLALTSPPPATERPELAQVEVAVPVVTIVEVAVIPAIFKSPAISASP